MLSSGLGSPGQGDDVVKKVDDTRRSRHPIFTLGMVFAMTTAQSRAC
jgi:hypothetical protein